LTMPMVPLLKYNYVNFVKKLNLTSNKD